MERNVYDFDKTVFPTDSTRLFFRYCLRHYPGTWLTLPVTAVAGVIYLLRIRRKIWFKQIFYRFLRYVPDIDRTVTDFWNRYECRMNKWYLEIKDEKDLIISASPAFLLHIPCSHLGVSLIASAVDSHTGRCDGENCHGEEKVKRMKAEYPDDKIIRFYSDSYSDTPLAKLAEYAYLVCGKKIKNWN